MRIPAFYRFVIRYVAPSYLIFVFVAFCHSNLGDWLRDVASSPVRQAALALIGAVTVFLLFCIRAGERRFGALATEGDLVGLRPAAVRLRAEGGRV